MARRGSGDTVGAPPASPFPSSSWKGRICAAATGVPGTRQLWGSRCFLSMELAPSLAPRPGGMLLLGSGQRKDTSLCRSMQGWIAPGWICTLNPFPGTREMLLFFPLSPGSAPGWSLPPAPFSCSFWALLIPRSLGSCAHWGAMALWGSVVFLLGSREMFPPPQPGLLGTGHFKGDWLFSSM